MKFWSLLFVAAVSEFASAATITFSQGFDFGSKGGATAPPLIILEATTPRDFTLSLPKFNQPGTLTGVSLSLASQATVPFTIRAHGSSTVTSIDFDLTTGYTILLGGTTLLDIPATTGTYHCDLRPLAPFVCAPISDVAIQNVSGSTDFLLPLVGAAALSGSGDLALTLRMHDLNFQLTPGANPSGSSFAKVTEWQSISDGLTVRYTFDPIPEPSTAVLLCGGLSLLLWLKRCRD